MFPPVGGTWCWWRNVSGRHRCGPTPRVRWWRRTALSVGAHWQRRSRKHSVRVWRLRTKSWWSNPADNWCSVARRHRGEESLKAMRRKSRQRHSKHVIMFEQRAVNASRNFENITVIFVKPCAGLSSAVTALRKVIAWSQIRETENWFDYILCLKII